MATRQRCWCHRGSRILEREPGLLERRHVGRLVAGFGNRQIDVDDRLGRKVRDARRPDVLQRKHPIPQGEPDPRSQLIELRRPRRIGLDHRERRDRRVLADPHHLIGIRLTVSRDLLERHHRDSVRTTRRSDPTIRGHIGLIKHPWHTGAPDRVGPIAVHTVQATPDDVVNHVPLTCDRPSGPVGSADDTRTLRSRCGRIAAPIRRPSPIALDVLVPVSACTEPVGALEPRSGGLGEQIAKHGQPDVSTVGRGRVAWLPVVARRVVDRPRSVVERRDSPWLELSTVREKLAHEGQLHWHGTSALTIISPAAPRCCGSRSTPWSGRCPWMSTSKR